MKTNQVEVVVFNAKASEVSYVADVYVNKKRVHCGTKGCISFSEALTDGYNWCKENLCPERGSFSVASIGKREAYGCKQHPASERLMPGVFKPNRKTS